MAKVQRFSYLVAKQIQMDHSLKQLLQSPLLPQYIREIQQLWESEQQNRKAFHEWVTPEVKAEFINGEVVLHSPAKNRHIHALKHLLILMSTWADLYELGKVAAEKAMISLSRNDYEPDICFWKQKTAESFQEDQMLFPAPDLVVEILSPTTEKKDRGVKFEDYAAHGITEYWIIDPGPETGVEQYLRNAAGTFSLSAELKPGEILSTDIMSGFRIPVNAIFDKKIQLQILKNFLENS